MEICRAKPSESQRLTELAYLAKESWGYPVAWLDEWKADLRFTEGFIECNEVFVAKLGGEVFGVVACGDSSQGPEISHLWIDPQKQGIGLGRALVDKAKEVAGLHGWKTLRVVSDPNAQGFYERMGGILVGELNAPVAGVARNLPILELQI